MSLDVTNLASWLRVRTDAAAVLSAPVTLFEPKKFPGDGLIGAAWLGNLRVVPGRSSLTATAAALDWNVRLYRNALGSAADADAIDPAMLTAQVAIIGSYHSDLEITDGGGNVIGIFDPIGGSSGGAPLTSISGYIEIEKRIVRVLTSTVSVIVDDAWTQVR